MAKRHSKTVAQQCRYYEVDNIFEYMVEVCINGNFSSFRRLYHELNKEARKDFIAISHLGMPAPIPHRDFTENRITILNYRQWKLLTFIWIAR